MTTPENNLEDVKSQPDNHSAKPEWQTPTLMTLELGADTASGCLCGFESCSGFIHS